jgi:hypothetical protein
MKIVNLRADKIKKHPNIVKFSIVEYRDYCNYIDGGRDYLYLNGEEDGFEDKLKR